MRDVGNKEWDAFKWERPVVRGVGVVVATPLDSNGQVIEEEFRRHLQWLVTSGVGYVQPSAATGQVMQTSDEEYARLLEIAVDECRGSQTLVTAYPGRADTEHTIRLTRKAQELGADCYFLVQPLFSSPNAEGLYRHYRAVIDSAPELPVVLYNNPARTAVQLPLDVVERLTDECEAVIGLKQADAAQLVASFQRLITRIPVWSRGEFDLLSVLALGGPGSISFSGNIIAPQLVQIYELWCKGDITGARDLFYRCLPVIQASHWAPIPAAIKNMMTQVGWRAGSPRLPIVDVDEALKGRLTGALQQVGCLD